VITALIIIFVAAISFALGVKVATKRADRILSRIQDELHDEADYNSNYDQVYETFADVLRIECPEFHAPAGEPCNLLDVWVCQERIDFANELKERGYDYVVSHDASPADPQDWIECGINNDCGHGCKIYRNMKTGSTILWHNAAYGCKQ